MAQTRDDDGLRISHEARGVSVAFLTGDYYPEQIGGQGIYAFEVTTRLAKMGLSVRVYCPDAKARRAFSYPPGLSLEFLPESTRNPLIYSALVSRRASEIASADLVHVNELFGFPELLRAKVAGKAVLSSHNSYLDRFRAARGLAKVKYPPLIGLERVAYPRARRLIIGSEIERQPMLELGVDAERIQCIPYGVGLERFLDPEHALRNRTRARLGIPANARVVLFVGRFVERKKPYIVAQAMKSLCASDPELYAILIGVGPESDRVQRIALEEPRIILPGAVPFDNLPEYYAAADVFTLPSVGEGSISLVVLEAAAAGLPLVLTADSCGNSVIFEDGRNGELAELDDAQDLERALSRALTHAADYGAHSRALATQHFSWDRCAEATWRCYQSALGRG